MDSKKDDMKYDFDEEINRVGTNCEKYDDCRAVFGRADVIPMWIADTDFRVPDFVTDALRKRLEHPVYGYSFRSPSYYKAIQGWVSRRNGWEVRAEWLGFSPGIVCGLAVALNAVSGEGDRVVIQPPVYPPFAQTITANRRVVVDNPLRIADGRYEIDFEDLDRKLEGARVFVLCNPHNPSGRVFTPEELRRMGELCVRHGVVIVSDEIHSDLLIKPHKHTHIASLSEEIGRRSITFIAPSKTFNIAGLSTSVAIIPDGELREKYNSVFCRVHIDQGNVFGSVALEAAYTHGDEWLDCLMDYIGGNMDFVVDYVSRHLPGVKAYKPESTFLMWLDFRAWGMEQPELEKFLVEKAGLGLNNGETFGREGIGYMRMNVGTTRAVLRKALDRLKTAYDTYLKK